MPAQKISLDKAKQEKLFYFVANVMVYRQSDKRCLILKRHEREVTHPGRYGVMGGKLEWKDLPINSPTRINGDVLDYENAIEALLMREAKEEAGIEFYPGLRYLDSVAFIRPDEVPVVLMKFAAKYKSGEVVLEEGGFTDHAWVNGEEVNEFPCIDGIPEEVRKTIEVFNS